MANGRGDAGVIALPRKNLSGQPSAGPGPMWCDISCCTGRMLYRAVSLLQLHPAGYVFMPGFGVDGTPGGYRHLERGIPAASADGALTSHNHMEESGRAWAEKRAVHRARNRGLPCADRESSLHFSSWPHQPPDVTRRVASMDHAFSAATAGSAPYVALIGINTYRRFGSIAPHMIKPASFLAEIARG